MNNVKTERLLLRPLQSTDSQQLFNIFSDPDVMEYWDSPAWKSIKEAEQFIENATAHNNNKKSLTLGIFDQKSQDLVGKCMLFNLHSESRRAELGFGISKKYWGKGIAYEAASALLEYGFSQMNLNRVEAEIDPNNIGSGKLLEKLGFNKEGYLPQRWIIDGVASDSAIFGLIAEQWKAS